MRRKKSGKRRGGKEKNVATLSDVVRLSGESVKLTEQFRTCSDPGSALNQTSMPYALSMST